MKNKIILLLMIPILCISSIQAQNALNFDGLDDGITTTFPGISGGADRTIEAWIRVPDVTTVLSGHVCTWGTGVNEQRFTLRVNNGVQGQNGAMRLEVQGGYITFNTDIRDGQWHHIALVFENDGSPNVIDADFYLDGVLDGSSSSSGITVNTGTAFNLSIGQSHLNPPTNFFLGDIDELRIWNVARTPAELMTYMNAGICNLPETNLVAYYQFDQGDALMPNAGVTTLIDSSGSNNNGTLLNFALTGSSSNFVTGAPISTCLCPAPTNLTVSNLTGGTVDLNWVESGTATQWDIEWGPQGFAQGTGTLISGTSNNPTSLSGLMANTSYDWYVRSLCGSTDVSNWVGPINFTTTCQMLSVPWLETFEANSNTVDCWTVLDNNGDGDEWELNTTLQPLNGARSAQIRTDFNAGNNDDYLISPQTSLTGNERLRYNYSVQSPLEPNDFQVLLSTTGNAPADFTEVLLPLASYDNDTYMENIIDLSAYTGDVYIAWHIPMGGLDGWRLFIDDVSIETIPSCVEPNAQSVSAITINSADLAWVEQGQATQWDIEWGPQGFAQGTGTLISGTTSNPQSITGLNHTTNYDWYVRSFCALGDTSTWTGPFSFETPCGVQTAPWLETFEMNSNSINCWTVLDINGDGEEWEVGADNTPFMGDQNAEINTDFNAGNNDDYLISPQLGLTGNERLRYFYRVQSATEPNDYELLISTTGTAPADFTDTILPNMEYNNTIYQEEVLDLSAYTGNVYIAWHIPNGGLDGWILHIDNVLLETIPDCLLPSNQSISALNTTSVDLDWTSGGAPNVEIEYGATDFALGTGTRVIAPTGTYNLTGLTNQTSYDWYVRDICITGDTSAWVGPFNFTTPCDAVVVPWFESFEQSSTTRDCWSIFDLNGDDDAWELDGTLAPFMGTNSALINTDFNGGNNDDYLITPPLTLTGNDRLRYFYRVQSVGEPNDFQVLVSTTGSAPADFTDTILPNMSYSNISYIEEVIDLSAYTGNIYIAWHVPSGGLDGWRIYIDNVIVEPIPSCLAPSGQMASVQSAFSVDLDWTSSGAANVEIEYGLTGFTLGTGTSVVAPTGIYNLTGLASQTSYDWYVRDICMAGDTSAWVGPNSFVTNCDAIPVPWLETFEQNSPILDCWNVVDANLDNDTWDLDFTLNPFAGTRSAHIHTDFNAGANDDFLITPQTILTGNERLRYFYSIEGDQEPNDLEILLSTTGDSPADFTETVLPLTTIDNEDYIENIIDLSAFSGNVYIAFHIPNGGLDGWRLYLDNVSIETIPTCEEPSNLGATVQSLNDVNLDWTSGGAANAEIQYGLAGFALGTGNSVVVPTGTYNLTGLMGQTEYDWYVRDVCGAGDSSVWIGPHSFLTGYCTPSSASTLTWIDDFSTSNATINISNLSSGFSTDGYEDFSATDVVSVMSGASFDFDIAIQGGTVGSAIWVDWNRDFVFDAGERVFNTTSYTNGPFNGTIMVPATASGNYTMRVVAHFNDLNPSDPCEMANRLEFEDYGISIINCVANTPTIIPVSLCVGDVLTLSDGSTESVTGMYEDTVLSSLGCDSAILYDLTVIDVINNNITETICNGDSYMFDGQMLTTTGNYSATFTAASGCDSIVNLALDVAAAIVEDIEVELCAGDSYMFDGQMLTMTGNYSATFTAAAGCDSIVNLALDVAAAIVEDIEVELCAGDSYMFDGQMLTTTGNYSATFTAASGCDSIVNLALDVMEAIVEDLEITMCDGESYVLDGQELSTTGMYSATFTAASGCDSVVNLNLTVNNNFNSTQDIEICGETTEYTLADGTVVNAAGTYTVTVDAVNGCDSVVTYNVSECVGIFEIENHVGLNIYPNPAKDVLNIEFDQNLSDKNSLSIVNILGQKVAIFENVSSKGLILNTSEFTSGIYFVNLNSDNKTTVQSFVIAK